jgi:uncharacterized membrane protein
LNQAPPAGSYFIRSEDAGQRVIHGYKSKKASAAGILFGIGLGGFVDGIVLHQILQWHNMLSNRIPPTTMEAMQINMRWDGLFHAAVWIVTLIAALILWSAARAQETVGTFREFFGKFLLGWGAFNLVEGIINHHILDLHYVRQSPDYAIYNYTFLAIGGVLFIVIGWWMGRTPNNGPPFR